MFNPNITVIIRGLGDIIGGVERLYVFSTTAMSSTIRTAIETEYAVDSLTEFVVVQSFPNFSSGSIDLLEPVSSGSSFVLELNANPAVRLLLDGIGTASFIPSGTERYIVFTTDVSDTEVYFNDVSGMSVGDVFYLGREAMEVTGINTGDDMVDVLRGVLGTTASRHYGEDEYNNPVVFTSIPTVVGGKLEVWSHDTNEVVARGQIESVSSDQGATMTIAITNSFFDLNAVADTAYKTAVNTVWTAKKNERGAIMLTGSVMLLLASQEPVVIPGSSVQALLYGKDKSVVINVEIVNNDEYYEGKKVYNCLPKFFNTSDPLLSYIEGEGWDLRPFSDFEGTYELHRFSILTDPSDLTIGGIVRCLLTGETTSGSVPVMPASNIKNIDIADVAHLGEELTNFEDSYVLPPAGENETFLNYLKDKILRPMAVGLVIHPNSNCSVIDWVAGINVDSITREDLSADQYTSTRDISQSLSKIEIKNNLTLISRRNRAYYGNIGKAVSLQDFVYRTVNVRNRWLNAMNIYELARHVFTFTLGVDSPYNEYKIGRLIDLNIARFPENDGTVGATTVIRVRILSAENSYTKPEVSIKAVAVAIYKHVLWSGALEVDGTQSSSETITVADGIFTKNDSDTSTFGITTGDRGMLVLTDKFLTPKSDNWVWLDSVNSSTSITISSVFELAGTPVTLTDEDIILVNKSSVQQIGWNEWDIGWFTNEDGDTGGYQGGIYV